MKTLAVFASLPAPPITAAWLRQALEPVMSACKFEKQIPIEIRPTGVWGGWCNAADFAPDGRVCISSKVVFWTGDRLKKVMLHEAAHRLLEGQEIEVHGPEFFALVAIFHTRAKLFFEDEPLNLLSIYDLQDVAETDKGHVLNWALSLAKELAPTDKSAEELASIVCLAWAQNVREREAKKLQAAREISAQINLKLEVKIINTKLFLWRALSAIGWGGMFATAYFSIVR